MIDRGTLRLVALGLLIICGIVVLGALWLTDHGKSVPDALIAIGSGALGSVGTLLVTSHPGTATPVQVVNQPNDPVPTSEETLRD